MKLRRYSVAIISILLVFFLFSCEEPHVEIPSEITYSTPTIKGTVSIPQGKNVSPSDVFIKVIDEEGKTATIQKANSDGTFVVQNLNERKKYSILFTSVEPEFTNRGLSRGPEKSDGVGGWLQEIVPSIVNGNDIGNVKLKPLGTIKGRALKDGENEHYDITVYIPGTSYIAMTDGEGNFSMYNVPEGSYRLRYTLDDHVAQFKEVNLVCPEDAENPEVSVGDVTLRSDKGSVVGRVTYDGESDHSGINILLESEDKSVNKTGLTAENGSFVIDDVKPGNYRILVSSSGYLPVYSSYFFVDAATTVTVPEQIILFRSIGTIKGVVTLSEERSDYSGISISIVGNGTSYSAVTSQDGSFVKIVKPGTYSVTASYPGFTSQTVEDVVTENATSTLSFPSLPLSSGGITGSVVLSGSEDYSGVIVSLIDGVDSSVVQTEMTAVDGSFRFSGIRTAGTYFLSFSKEGYVSDNSRSVDVTIGSVSVATVVTLRATTATVRGNVILDGASTHENITVLLRNEDEQYNATTDQNGEFLINRVLPGTYTLMASKDGYVTRETTEFVVEPAVDKTIESLSLSVAKRSVIGSVQLELATDHAGVLVTATNLSDSNEIYSAISNSSGNFTLAGMKAGEYSVVLSSAGYNTITLPTINVTSTTVYEIQQQNLEISRGKIAGLVKLEGYTDHSGVRVSILGTDYSTLTSSDGSFEISVPTANYPGGLRFEKEDMETAAYAETIPVLVNSTYAIKRDITLSAINVPVISGTVKVGGTEDWSGVTVKIAEKPEFSFVTEANGEWRFEHVPLGNYTLEYTRENASKVTSNLVVKAGPSISVPALTIIPDSANIEGYISLGSVTDYSGVIVRVVTDNVENELSTRTDSTGYFYLGNLLSTGNHTVYFEKAGWDSQSISLSGLEPLSLTNVTNGNPITLLDTTTPVLSSVSINNGSNSTGNRTVTITVDAHENGSGIALMQYSWTDSFAASPWLKYSSSFEITIPEESNGTKTLRLRVKDATGNESETVSDSIELVNQIKSIGGQLSIEELHWVKENNPYVITNDVIIPEGRTLIIDPGVDILFDGNYSINIRGDLYAVGTEDDPIVFRSSKNYMEEEYNGENYTGYDGDWGGISSGTNELAYNTNPYEFSFISGSILSYCVIEDISNGINGKMYVSNCEITSNRYAVGTENSMFKGVLLNSVIVGNSRFEREAIIYGNIFESKEDNYNIPTYAYFDEYWGKYYWNDPDGSYHEYSLNFIQFDYCQYITNNKFKNCNILVYDWNDTKEVYLNTFDSCYFQLRGNTLIDSCEFINNRNAIEFGSIKGIVLSNFLDNKNQYIVKTTGVYSEIASHDFRYNYWGESNTNKLDSLKGSKNFNVDFIYDGYDDISRPIINYDDYSPKPWAMAGYHEEGIDRLSATIVKQVPGTEEAKVGSDISFELTLGSREYLADYRIAQSITALIDKEWSPYQGECTIYAEEIDFESTKDGWLTFFIQGRKNNGKETEIISIDVGCGAPVFTSFSIEEGKTFTSDGSQSIHGTFINKGCNDYKVLVEVYIDEVFINSTLYIDTVWENNFFIYPDKLSNGEHELKVVLTDAVGDSTTKRVKFNIDRTVPIVQGVNYSASSLGVEDTLSISVKVVNSKHLKTLKVKSGDRILLIDDFVDNGSTYVERSYSLDAWKIGEGENDFYIELEDYAGNITVSNSEKISSSNTQPSFTSYSIEEVGDSISYSATVNNTLHLKSIRLVSDGKTVAETIYPENGSTTVSVENSAEKWKLNDGDHEVWLEAVDYADSVTSTGKTEISVSGTDFYIDSYEIVNNQFDAVVNVNIKNAQHIQEISVFADNNLVGYELFNNYNDEEISSSITIDTWLLKDGRHNIRIEVKDYSDRIVVVDGIELLVENVNPKVETFVATMVEDTLVVDLTLSNTKHIDYICISVDDTNNFYEWLKQDNPNLDTERHYVIETKDIGVGQHYIYAQIHYDGDTWLYSDRYYFKTAVYEPRINSLTFNSTSLSADENLVIDLNVINARHIESISVCVDTDGNHKYYEGFTDCGNGQITRSISIPSGIIGSNGTHSMWVEVKKYGSDIPIKSRQVIVTLNDVEPRATSFTAREDGDNILLDLSAVNMKGVNSITVTMDGNHIETYSPGTEMPSSLEKTFSYEKWRLGDGDHTFKVYAETGAMYSKETGSVSYTITGVNPVIESFTVSSDINNVTSKVSLSNAEHIVRIHVYYNGSEYTSYTYEEGLNPTLIQVSRRDVASLGDGDHTVKFVAVDSLGRIYETEEKTFTLAGTKLEIEKCDVSVIDDQIKLDLKINNAYRLYCVRAYLDGEYIREDYIYDNKGETYEGTWYYNVKNQDSGLHTFRVEVTDTGWNGWVRSQFYEVNLTKYEPSFASVTVDKNSLEGDQSSIIDFTIDKAKYIKSLNIKCDERNIYSEEVPTYSSNSISTISRSISLDSWILGDGTHSIVVSATDVDGITINSDPITISVSGSLVEISSFNTTETEEALNFSISLIRTEHLKELRVVSDGKVVASESFENGTISSLDKTFNIEKWKLDDGEHKVRVEAEDYAGNIVSTDETTVTVTGSRITIDSFTVKGEEDSINLQMSLSNTSHLKSIRTYADGQEINMDSFVDKGPSTFTYDLSISKYRLQDGTRRIRLEAEDYNGNRIMSEEKAITVSGTTPRLLSYSVEIVDDQVVFSGELNHINGFDYYDFYYDNGWLGGYNDLDNTVFSKSFSFDSINKGNRRFYVEIRYENGTYIRSKDTILNIFDYKPVISSCSLDKTNLGALEDFNLTLSIENAKHLKELRVVSNESVLYSKSFGDNGNGTFDSVIALNSRYFITGTYDIVVEAEDYKGNTVSQTLQINVTNSKDTGPIITNFNMEDGVSYTENTMQVFDFTISDAGGVKSIIITLDGTTSLYNFVADTYRENYNDIPVTLRLRVPAYINGTHQLSIQTTDFAGKETTINRTFTISKVLPEVSLSLYESTNKYNYYTYGVNNPSWVYDLALYVDGVIYKHSLYNYGEETGSIGANANVYFDGLSAGKHTVCATARMQSGEVIRSSELTFNVDRSVDDSSYGPGKSWNDDGTLVADDSTLLLWDFDNADPSIEAVNGYGIGDVYETANGLGGKSGRMYIDKNMVLQFPNSTWTIEYWGKNNSSNTCSSINLMMEDVFRFYYYKQEYGNNTYLEPHFSYENIFSEVSSEYLYTEPFARRDTEEWHHFAFVSTGTGFEIYVDGVRRNFSSGDKPSVRIADRVYISMPEGAFVDEVRISDKARSVDELWSYVQHVKRNNLLPSN